MSSRTYLRFLHTANVYTKNETVGNSGQKKYTYKNAGPITCLMQSSSSERRTSPYLDNIDEYQIYVPFIYNSLIDYKNRIFNIKDRNENILENGPLEIIHIEKKFGVTGKLNHILVTVRKVVENA